MNWNRGKNSSAEKAVNGGGEIETMNWSRDKNSSEEKTVHREILLHVGLGGKLNNELDSKQELFGRESCEWKNLLHVQLWGGKFKQ